VTGEWVLVKAESKKKRDKILTFFSKASASGEEIEIYILVENLL
jgi:hypothetical protein